MVSVRIRQHTREMNDAFRDHIMSCPEVISAQHIAGENDYLIHVVVRDVDHLRNFTLDELTAREEVGHVETALVFDDRRTWVLPDYGIDSDAPGA